MHDVDRARRAAAAPARCRGAPSTFGSARVRRRASATRSACGSTPITDAAVAAKRGRWKPVPQPRSRTVRPAQGAIGAPSPPRSGRPGRPRGSRPRTSRCGARCWGSGPRPAGAGSGGPQIRTRPCGVWTCAAMMPGVPCGATHSTLTSSSGASTVSPSHSLTRCGSPAISRQAREKAPSAPALGCSSSGMSHCDEERQLRVGDQAVDADLLPEQLGAVGAVPVAVGGLAAEPLLDHGDVVDRDDPAEPAAAEGGAGAHGLAERRLVGRGVVEHLDDLEVGVVGQRQDHVAGAEARVHAAVGERRGRAVPRCAGRCWQDRQVRLRRRDGPGACQYILGNAPGPAGHRGRIS